MGKSKRIEEISHREMDGFTDPRIKEVRIMGGCTCVEVHDGAALELSLIHISIRVRVSGKKYHTSAFRLRPAAAVPR